MSVNDGNGKCHGDAILFSFRGFSFFHSIGLHEKRCHARRRNETTATTTNKTNKAFILNGSSHEHVERINILIVNNEQPNERLSIRSKRFAFLQLDERGRRGIITRRSETAET